MSKKYSGLGKEYLKEEDYKRALEIYEDNYIDAIRRNDLYLSSIFFAEIYKIQLILRKDIDEHQKKSALEISKSRITEKSRLEKIKLDSLYEDLEKNQELMDSIYRKEEYKRTLIRKRRGKEILKDML